jgi:hypothetical protein
VVELREGEAVYDKAKVDALYDALAFIQGAPIYDCNCETDIDGDRLVCVECQCSSTIKSALEAWEDK